MTGDAARRADLLGRLERWTEAPLTALALLLVPVLLAPALLPLSSAANRSLDAAAWAIWGCFAADLAAKLAVAPDRLGYLRRHWVDVLLVVVPVLRPLRGLRLLRLLWAAGAAARVFDGARRLLRRRGFGFVLLAAALVVFVAAGLALAAEQGAPEATIRTYPDALWWAVATVTTVGYGDRYPVTNAGQGVAVALMLLGIALFGAVTANLAAFFVEGQDEEMAARLVAVEERIGRMEGALDRIAAAVERSEPDGRPEPSGREPERTPVAAGVGRDGP